MSQADSIYQSREAMQTQIDQLHRQIVPALVKYDDRQARSKYYNSHALALYLQALDATEFQIIAGHDVRAELVAHFTGRLLDVILKAIGLPISTDAEQRS